MSKAFAVLGAVVLVLALTVPSGAQSTNIGQSTASNLLAGDGLIRVRSAKPLQGFPFQFRDLTTYRTVDWNLNAAGTLKDKMTEAWSYQFLSYAPVKDAELDVTLTYHGEQWSPANPYGASGTKLGLFGDGLVGLKLHAPFKTPAFDVAIEPFVSIPTASDSQTIHNKGEYISQSGGVDFGGMLLMDFNLPKTTFYVNGGLVKHASQESQVLGSGAVEYAPSPYLSAFLEGSAAYRLSQRSTASILDWQKPFYRGEQFTVAHITPGVKVNAGNWASLDLAGDFGVTTFGPKWQFMMGLSLPSALKVRAKAVREKRGVIAGRITDGKTGKALDAQITFPGSDLATLQADKLGNYAVQALAGDYTVKILADGYLPQEKRITLADKAHEQLDFALARKPPPLGTLVGKIFDALTDKALPASIAIPGVEGGKVMSDVNTGAFTVKLPPGTYTSSVTTALANYLPEKLSFVVKSDAVSNVAVSMVQRGQKISVPGVRLLGTQATLAPESYLVLEKIGKILTDRKSLRLVIAGHVDSRGTLKRQLALSQSMANAVKSYFVQQLNVAADRLFVNAYGGTMPVASNRTAVGRLQNRRVEMLILGEGEKVPEVAFAMQTPTPNPNPTPTPTPTPPKPTPNPTPIPPKPTPTPTPTPPKPTPTPTPTAGDAQAAYRAGVEAYFNDNYNVAIANFQKCLKLDPTNSKARDYLAKAKAKAAKTK